MAALQNLLTDVGENDIAKEFLDYSVTVDDGEMCIDKPVDISNEDIDILDIFHSDSNSSADELSEKVELLENNLPDALGAWTVGAHLSRDNLSSLLSLLRKHNNPELPADARTLLSTPRTVDIKFMAGGEYAFLGIAAGLERLGFMFPMLFHGVKEIFLQCNIDGFPLFKSSSVQLWPILCKYETHPFILAVWSGESKPSSVQQFLSDFLQEYSMLTNNGVVVRGQKISFTLETFICDAPARAFLKCIKGHCGYYGCERCVVKGEYDG